MIFFTFVLAQLYISLAFDLLLMSQSFSYIQIDSYTSAVLLLGDQLFRYSNLLSHLLDSLSKLEFVFVFHVIYLSVILLVILFFQTTLNYQYIYDHGSVPLS
jgi:hypothetical protein